MCGKRGAISFFCCAPGFKLFLDGELRQQTIGEPRPPVLEGHPINTKRSRPKAVIGKVEGVLFVVFVENEDELGTSTRIISARAADEEEVAAYFEELMY